jgi:hypothetical protein
MEPRLLPEFVHDLETWTRESAPTLWSGKSAQGSPFYWPAGISDPSTEAIRNSDRARELMSKKTKDLELIEEASRKAHAATVMSSFTDLANFHADTLETASLHYVGKDIAFLAARAEMKEFRLDAEILPTATGFIMWDTPIGEAEPRGQLTAYFNTGTGVITDVEVIDDMMEGFRDSETPVNAASWRILEGGEEILVTFYSDGVKAAENYREWASRQKAGHGMTLDRSVFLLQQSDPQPIEREQVLPIGKALSWFDDESQENRLRPTIISDPDRSHVAKRFGVAHQYEEANRKVLPMLTQMVKTFVSTLIIRKIKLASVTEESAPKPSVKRMRRGGASVERQESKVQIVRVGAPIQHRNSSGGKGGGKWKVKTLIGPVIRNTQYVPAYDEYRKCIPPKVIGPYIAGPADAPWSDKVKVFLLE